MLYLANKEKNLLREQKIIKLILAIIISGSLVLLMFVLKDLFYGRNRFEFEFESVMHAYGLMGVNLLLTVMAYISSGIYFLNNNEDSFFIISLYYLSMLINALVNANENIMNNYFIQILSPLLRLFIISRVVNKKKTFSKENKLMDIIIVSILSIITSKIDGNISNLVITDKYRYLGKISFFIMIIIIILYLVVNKLLIKKSIKEIQSVYVSIIASLYLIIMRGLYFLSSAWNPETKIIQRNFYSLIYLTIMANVAVVCGVFIEIIKEINENKKLQKELNIFYYVSEFDHINNILITDSEWNIIYANKTLINNYCSKENIEEQYKEIEDNFYRYGKISCDDVDTIHKEAENKGYWKGKFVSENHESAILLDVKRITYENQTYFSISFNDITTEHKLSKEIEEKEALLTTINDNIQEALIGISDDDTIKYVNKSTLDMFNYKEEELIGENLNKIINSCKDIEFSDTNSKYTFVGIDSIGNEIELLSVCNDINEENDANLKKIIISKDLTEEKKYEKLNFEYNKIKAYENAKNEFFANLSHELRTPINVISSTLQLLNKSKKSNIYKFINFYDKYENALGTNCYRMLRLVNNLIDITKIDVGAIEPRFVNTNIVELIENISLSIIPYAKEKNINMIFDTDIEELIIRCDMEKIEKIILNLLSNSIKFSERDKTILVNITSNKEWVKVTVQDEGRGIPESMKDFIFDRFVQVDKSLNRKTEGSGIGLSIVKALVDMHEGNISVSSEINKGSTFDVYLPNKMLEGKGITSFDEFNIDTKKIELELSDIYELYS